MTWAWAVVIPALVVLAVGGWYWERHRVRRVIGRRLSLAELLAADPRDPGTWPGVPPLHPADDRPSEPACGPVTHLLPPESEGEYLTVCCGRSPFDLAADREPLTIRPENVTCGECGRRS